MGTPVLVDGLRSQLELDSDLELSSVQLDSGHETYKNLIRTQQST